MKSREIKFKNKNHNYSIIIGKNVLNILPKRIKLICPNTKSIAILFDDNVPKKFKSILKKNSKTINFYFYHSRPMRKINLLQL